MAADKMTALLQSQHEAIGHLQACLEGLAVAKRDTVPDLNVAVVEEFLGGGRVASWMRQLGKALRVSVLRLMLHPFGRPMSWATPWNVHEETTLHTSSGE